MAAQQSKREWDIDIEDYESIDAFRGDVAQALAELEAIGYRLGGAFLVAPIRVPVGERYVTTGWRFRHTGMPAARSVEVAPVTEPDLIAAEDEAEQAMAEAEEEQPAAA